MPLRHFPTGVGFTDKFGNTGSAVAETTLTGVTFTSGKATLTSTVSVPAGRVYVYNKTFVMGTNGGIVINRAAGNHVFFVNCQFYYTAGQIGGSVRTGSTFQASGTGFNGNTATGPLSIPDSETGGASANFYGCSFSGPEALGLFGAYFENCTFDNPNAANFNGSLYCGPGNRWDGATLNNGSGAGAHAEIQFRGSPTQFDNVILDSFFFTTQGEDFNRPLVAVNPQFVDTDAVYFANLNGQSNTGNDVVIHTRNRNNGLIILGPYIWDAPTTATVTATSEFANKILYGGQARPAGNAIVQLQGWNDTWYNDGSLANPAEGIRTYVRTNAGYNTANSTQAGWYTRINAAANSEANATICEYITDETGKYKSQRVSFNNASTWLTGYVNWFQFNYVNAADATTMLQTFPGQTGNIVQTADEHTIASPVQIAQTTGTGNSAVSGTGANMNVQHTLYSTIEYRGYAYANGTDISVPLSDSEIGRNNSRPVYTRSLINERSQIVKADNVVDSELASRSNIESKFDGTTQITLNDIHDAMRWLWSNYETAVPPAVSGGIAQLFTTSANALANVEFVSTGTFGLTSGTLQLHVGDNDDIVGDANEAVNGIQAGDVNINSTTVNQGRRFRDATLRTANINNPRVFSAPIALNNRSIDSAFSNVTFAGTQNSVNIAAPADRYISFDECNVSGSMSVNRASGTGTIYVYGLDPNESNITFGTGVQVAPQDLLLFQNDTGTTIYYYASDTDGMNPQSGSLSAGSDLGFANSTYGAGDVIRFHFSAAGYDELANQLENITLTLDTQVFNVSTYLSSVSYITNATLIGTVTPEYNDSDIDTDSDTVNVDGVVYNVDSDTSLKQNAPHLFLRTNGDVLLDGAGTVRMLQEQKNSAAYARVCAEDGVRNIISLISRTTASIDTRYVIFAPGSLSCERVLGVVASNDNDSFITASGGGLTLRRDNGQSGINRAEGLVDNLEQPTGASESYVDIVGDRVVNNIINNTSEPVDLTRINRRLRAISDEL